jgi:uncharacterized protein YceK
MRLLFLVILAAILSGCASVKQASVPDGYDLDVTPGCDGSNWR